MRSTLATRQFTIRKLLIGTMVIAVLLGFLGQEPVSVGLAAIFCVLSWIGILILSLFTIRNLVGLIGISFRKRQFGGLTTRFRWAYLDVSIITWIFFTIVISNFVVANSVANARYLIWAGWALLLVGFVAGVGRIAWNSVVGRPQSDNC